MKKTLWQQVMPHLISIGIFLIVALIFCKPALESDTVIKQGDITHWQGMVHQMQQYKEQHGHFPLWATNMYAGMPGYQIAMDGPWTPIGIINTIMQLGLPKPISFFFLACVCFYILCMCLRIRPWVAVIGSIAFAYCSTFPQFITGGHDTQMFALAYTPAVLGGVLLLFDKKYITGFVLTALFTGLQIVQGHQQITYYMFLIIGIMSLFLLINSWRAGSPIPPLKAIGLTAVASIIGIALSAVTLLTVYDYSKESKRNGQLVMDQNKSKDEVVSGSRTKGLSKEYAFQWSLGKEETLTLMFPGIMGYGEYYAERDNDQFIFPKLDENSHVAKYLTEKLNVPEDQAAQIALGQSGSLYWGDQPFTAGPIYIGAVLCLLFIFAMVYLEGPHKWWIVTAAILGIVLAWGKHFAGFNYFLFDHLPFYNKFRVPTMALEITELVIPIAAVLALEKLVANPVIDLKKMRLTAIITAAVFVIAAMLYFTMDYGSENKKRTAAITQAFSANNPNIRASLDSINRVYEPEADNKVFENILYQSRGNAQLAHGILTGLKEDRQKAFGNSIVRSLIYVLLAMGLGFLFIRKKINALMMLAGLGLLTAIDLITFDSNYLNSYSFDSKERYEANEFPLTAADQAILKDKDPNFRVLNTTVGDPYTGDARTSYYHKSIGGYHPARLGIYDDLIEYQLSGSPNPAVLNMLNTKYVIEENQQGKAPEAVQNPNALGNVWFVKNIKWVHGQVEEMKAMNNLNPAETAIVDDAFKTALAGSITPADSTASIKQVAFDNDDVKYESNSAGTHLAVFSEIFYKDWKATIDGKPAVYGKADYVLRTMVIPAGKHSIEFKFEPKVYNTGYTITAISGWLLTLLVLGYIFWLIRPMIGSKTSAPAPAKKA